MSDIAKNAGEETGVPKSESQVASGASGDRPLSNPGDDRLGYAPFARALAAGIGSMYAPEGLVLAIYGAWGLGKTTALNFVEHYLNEDFPNQFVVVNFNPWWFSGRVDVATAFFEQLQPMFQKGRVFRRKARRTLAQFVRVVGAARGQGASDAAAIIEGSSTSVPTLKKELSDALSSQSKRLLIIIDDIDRLAQNEVAELFAVVKALADFPSTIYLLAFDRNQVAEALTQRTGQSGSEYLEKIVQVPFELPLPEHESLRVLFLEHLQEIVGDVESDFLDIEELGALITKGLGPLMKTPRDIVRLTNSLRITYEAVRGEVNVTDFVALEALRVFEPAVYDCIRARPDLFGILTGPDRMFPQVLEKEQQTFHSEWVSGIGDAEERAAIKQIVARLFPETAQIIDAHLGVGRRRIDTRRSRAISEPDYFPTYFRFALSDQVFSREAISALVGAAADSNAFGQRLLALADEKTRTGRTRASVMLDELVAQAERGFSTEHIPSVIKSLVNIGDQLWIESDHEFFGVDNETRIVWLVSGLLERVPPEERCDLLKAAIKEATSIGTPVLLVRRLIRSLGVATDASAQAVSAEELDERQALISIQCAKVIEQATAEKISSAATACRLWGLPRLPWVLAEWSLWGDRDAVHKWLDGVLADDEQLGQFLVTVRSERVTREGVHYRLDPRWIDNFAPRDDVANAVRRLRGVVVGGDVADACDQYLAELEALEQGNDPEVRF